MVLTGLTCGCLLFLKKKNNERKQRIDERKLHLPNTQEQYADDISNRFASYKKKKNDDSWEVLKNTVQEVSKQVLGSKEAQGKEWITDATLDLVTQRRVARSLSTSDPINTRVKRSLKCEKQKWESEVANKIEEAAEKKDTRKVCKRATNLWQAKHSNIGLVKDKNGEIITAKEKQMERWAQHFREVLNRHDPVLRFDDIPSIEV